MWGKKIGKNRHEGIRCELPTVSQSAPRWSGTPDVAAVVAGIGRANQQCRRRMSAVDEQSTNGKAHQCDNTWRVRCGLCGRRVCWHCGLHTTPPVAKTHNSFEDVRFHTFIRSPSKKKTCTEKDMWFPLASAHFVAMATSWRGEFVLSELVLFLK